MAELNKNTGTATTTAAQIVGQNHVLSKALAPSMPHPKRVHGGASLARGPSYGKGRHAEGLGNIRGI